MRKYIIVDEDNKPMSFSHRDGQLCYVRPRGRSRFYLKTYSEGAAITAIRTTVRNRIKWKMHKPTDGYYLMPLAL